MSGIAAVKGANNGELDRIMERIKHRGPDHVWTSRQSDVSIGCLDLSVGNNGRTVDHCASAGGIDVVLDGRVYNPSKPGMKDAEAVLDLYRNHGTGFARRIDGDFACIISDGGQLVAARDCVGVKPLYYGHFQDGLCFSSEVKGLVDLTNDVREFPPGHVYSQDFGFQRFSCEAATTPEFEDYEQGKKVLKDLLMEAVERRMRDGAVGGVLLSGGLDSSLITYMAYQINPNIECFTVSMDDGQDLPLAKDVTKYLGIKHHILMFGREEIHEVLPQAIYHQEMYEQDCVHGAIANFLAGRFVRPKTNCVLTGEGADEFLAGYDGQFKQGRNQEELASIVHLLIDVAHNTGLQRLDRLAAASGIETRTPFLDSKVIDFCLKIPLQYKVHGEEQVGKWILRQAFEGCLPDHVIYQTKRFFAQGSGVAWIMRSEAEKYISQEDLDKHNSDRTKPWLATVEELYYYRIFKQSFPGPEFDRVVGRWDPMKPDFFLRMAGN